MNIAEKTLQLKQDFDEVYEAGKKAEYDAFWDALQDFGKRTNYANGFFYHAWNDDNFRPKYDIKTTNAANMFRGDAGAITDLEAVLQKAGVVLDTSNCTSINNGFRYGTFTVLPVIDVSKAINSSAMVAPFDYKLVTIRKLISSAETFWLTNTFQGLSHLTNLIIEGVIGTNDFNVQWSPLTHDSLMSIINALQDKTGDTSGTVWEVIIGKTNREKLTTEEQAIATAKGWILS